MNYYRSFMPHDFFSSLASSPLGVLMWLVVYFGNMGLCMLVMALCVFNIPEVILPYDMVQPYEDSEQ